MVCTSYGIYNYMLSQVTDNAIPINQHIDWSNMASYSKYETAHGTMWRASFRIIDTDGKYRQKTLRGFKTKKEAEKAYMLFDNSKQKVKESQNVTFNVVCNAYLQQKRQTCKESSVYCITDRIAQLNKFFDGMCIDNITPKTIIEWQDTLQGYRQAYKEILRALLNSILLFASRYYGTNKAVIEAVPKPRSPEELKNTALNVWSVDEFHSFIGTFPENSVHYLFFCLLWVTGCRKGEITALTIDNVDFTNNSIYICQNLTRKVTNASYKITTPKNAQSVRSVSVPSVILQKIKEHLAGRNKGFVFSLTDGDNPLSDKSIDRAFLDGIAKSGVRKIRIHDIRHSHASLLISNGVSIVAVAKRLGHRDIRETLNTYAHFLPADEEQIKRLFDILL